MDPTSEVKLNLAAPIIDVPPRPGSDTAEDMQALNISSVLGWVSKTKGAWGGKVVVAQVSYSQDFYVCVGFGTDYHNDILDRGLTGVLGPDWRQKVANASGGDFKIDWATKAAKVSGYSTTLNAEIGRELVPQVERAITAMFESFTAGAALPQEPLAGVSNASAASPAFDSRLGALDVLIKSGAAIQYNGGDFKDDRVVGQFVNDHRTLRTGLLGAMIFLYSDPCGCCIPSYGPREMLPKVSDPEGAVQYVREKIGRGETPDLLFVNEAIYRGAKEEISTVSPDTKLIVACDRRSSSNASELRNQGIPAIDDQDYLNCAPLNAVIALTVFDKLMSSSG